MPATVSIDVNDLVRRAQEAFNRGFNGEGCGIAEDLYERLPNVPPIQMLMAHRHAVKMDIPAAIKLARLAITQQQQQQAQQFQQQQGGAPQAVADWHTTLAGWLLLVGSNTEAIVHARAGLKQQFGESSRGRLVLGKAHWEAGDIKAALTYTVEAIAANKGNPDAHLHLAEILLSQGDWRPGWAEYEWRNELSIAMALPEQFKSSFHWNGYRSLANAELVVIGDQGFGDVIQFARYLPKVAEMFAGVHVGVSPELLDLMRRSFGHCVRDVFSTYGEIPHHTVHCRMSSLPWALGETDDPPWSGAYLKPDPLKVAQWRGRLGGGPSVGIAWSGRPSHPNNIRRSTDLSTFAPLLEVPGIRFVSLQKPIPDKDRDLAAKVGLVDVSPDLNSFDDTAALIRNLDAVVCVDTAVAHIAGALDRPTWIIAPKHTDWRWQTGKTNSWYPSVTVLRQHAPCDWTGPIGEALEIVSGLAGQMKEAAD